MSYIHLKVSLDVKLIKNIFIYIFILGEGHNFFKSIFIEKIYYEYPAAAGFRFSLIFAPSVKEKMSRRQKQNDLYEFRRTILHLEGESNR